MMSDEPSREIFRRYAAERKATVPAGYRADVVEGLTRYTPIDAELDGIVMFSELSDVSIDNAISAQIAYFKKLNRPFEWKVYSMDSPPDLAERLESRGFERGDTEGFLIYSVAAHVPLARAGAARIERITTASGIQHIVRIQEEIWGRSLPWLESSLRNSLDRVAIFCAYIGDAPVGGGWIEFPGGSTFAELHGGAVLPAQRNRGIYSALFDVRVEEAKRRKIQHLTVDAAPMSRPILLKKGFRHVCDTIPFRKDHLAL